MLLRVVSLSTARAPVLSLLVTGVRRAFVVVMGVLSLMRCPVVTPHSRMGVRGDLLVKSRAAQAPRLVLPLFTGSSFAAGHFNENDLLQMANERFAAGLFNINSLLQMTEERFAAGLFNINSLLQMAEAGLRIERAGRIVFGFSTPNDMQGCMTVNSTVRVPAERKHPQPARLRVSFCRLLSCQAEIPEISVISDGHAHPVLQFPDFLRGEVYAIADHAGISIPSQRQFLTIPHMSVQISPRIKGRISSSTMNSRPGPTGPAWRRYSACCSISLLPRSEGISSRYVG